MKMTGEQKILRDRTTVWQALNDLEVLKECIPGCDSITTVGDNEHEVSMVAAVGPVKAKFKGKLKLTDIIEPTSYRIQFEGQGGAAGFAKGEAEVTLQDDGAETLLQYTADAQVGGKLAQIGSRLIDAAAKKIAGDFFARFNERVAAPADATEAAPVESSSSQAVEPVAKAAEAGQVKRPAAATPVAPSGSSLPAWVWALGGAVVGSVLTYILAV